MPTSIILIGPPACGKGTQGSLLSKEFGIPVIKPGNLYREHIKNQTPLGKIAQPYVERGALLPDEYTNELIQDELRRLDVSKGVIIDGAPRSIGQAHMMEKYLENQKIFFINVSDDEVRRRIREHNRGRTDDTVAVVDRRLRVYHENYDALLEYYKDKPYFYVINGEQRIEGVFREIVDILKK